MKGVDETVRSVSDGLDWVHCGVRVWAYDAGNRLQARVTVALPEPGLIAPFDEAPAGVTTLVPWGTAIQVLKEENHFDVLFNHVPPEGTGLLLVSLHKAIRTLRNGVERPFVEVRLEGERVGELSNVTSAHLLPLLEHTETIGETALAYAKISGSALAARLFCTPPGPSRSATTGCPTGHTRPQNSSHGPRDMTPHPPTPYKRCSAGLSE